jgi:hypothetical protein
MIPDGMGVPRLICIAGEVLVGYFADDSSALFALSRPSFGKAVIHRNWVEFFE